MNEPAAKPVAKKRGLRRRYVLVGVGAAAGGLAITKALGLYNLPGQPSTPGQTQSPTLAGVDWISPLDKPEALAVCERPTPELYLGYKRGRIANPEGFTEDRIANYQLSALPAGALPTQDAVELSGPWFADAQFAAVVAHPAGGEPSSLRLAYSAAEINLVMAPGTNPFPSRLHLTDNGSALDHQSRGTDVREDDDGSTWIEIDRPRMYSLVKRDRYFSRTLALSSRSTGLQLFAFTFVSCVPRP